jgi:hypothetical protein
MRSRAAKVVSASAVTPAARAISVARIRDHHSAGTQSRCHHFETADDRAPMSDAIASREDQSCMTARNDVESGMPESIRQLVLNGKDILSRDGGKVLGHNVLMKAPDISTKLSAKQFKDHFTARVAFARHRAGYTQATMAEALGFGPVTDASAQGKYHKYEGRSLMPHHLIPQFCVLCDISTSWLLAGPVVARPVEKRGRKAAPPPSNQKRAI